MAVLREMGPGFAGQNLKYGGLVDAEFRSQGAGHAPYFGGGAYQNNVRVGKLGVSVPCPSSKAFWVKSRPMPVSASQTFGVETRTVFVSAGHSLWAHSAIVLIAGSTKSVKYRVLGVLASSAPLKVVRRAIRLFSVFMIYLRKALGVRQESLSDKSVNESSQVPLAGHETDTQISVFAMVRLEYSLRRIVSYSSEIANRIVRRLEDFTKLFRCVTVHVSHGAPPQKDVVVRKGPGVAPRLFPLLSQVYHTVPVGAI